MLAMTVGTVIEGSFQIPCWDQWDTLYLIEKTGTPLWTKLWFQHNEHRIPIPRLFALADLSWFQGRNTFLYIAIIALQFLHLAVFAFIIRRWLPRWLAITGIAAAGICLLNPLQMENFLWGFQISFVGVFLFSTLSFVLLVLHSERSPRRGAVWLYVLSLACSALAAGCLINGLLTGVLLIPLALLIGVRWRYIGGILLFIILLPAGYFYGLLPTAHHTDPATALRHPADVFLYVVYYISGALSTLFSSAGPMVGLTGVALAFFLSWVLLTEPRLRTRGRSLLLVGCWFILATAASTALGRLEFGLGQALSSRYQTPALLFWCFLALLLADLASSWVGGKWVLATLQLFLLLGTFMTAVKFPALFNEYRERGRHLRQAGAAVALGTHQDSLTWLYPTPEATLDRVNILRDRKLSVFTEPAYQAVGNTLSTVLRLVPGNRCLGYVDGVETAPAEGGGVQILGWAWDLRASRRARNVVFCDRRNRVVGLGVPGEPRPDVPIAVNAVSGNESGWRGLSWRPAGSGELTAYAILSDGSSACPFATVKIPGELAQVAGPGFIPIWIPSMGVPDVRNATAAPHGSGLTIRSNSIDPQMYFHAGRPLNHFAQIAVRARFGHQSRIEVFFGRQVDGRSLAAVVPEGGRWFTVLFPVSTNPFWRVEAAHILRFDPSSEGAVGAGTEVAGVWGLEDPAAAAKVVFEPLAARN
jgi:hypothetical protein